jgi:hypothetical protein
LESAAVHITALLLLLLLLLLLGFLLEQVQP